MEIYIQNTHSILCVNKDCFYNIMIIADFFIKSYHEVFRR